MRHGIGSARVSVVVIAVLLGPGAFAQQQGLSPTGPGAIQIVDGVQVEGDVPPPQAAWGVAALSSVTYSYAAFVPFDTTWNLNTWIVGTQLCRNATASGNSSYLDAAINLPNGALIHSVEFTLCDSTLATGINSWLLVHPKNTNPTVFPLVSTTAGEAPGCVNRSFVFGAPIQVDNATNAYSLQVGLGATNNTTAICQARVNYRLQASPAPAFATFADVPTSSPFHRFVEALVASGVTGGCAPGLYCPDAPVTRAQMAVFLSVALGLHFPG